MKKKNQKRDRPVFDEDYEFKSSKKHRPPKSKNKKKFSIYDDFEDEEDFIMNEKFGKRRK